MTSTTEDPSQNSQEAAQLNVNEDLSMIHALREKILQDTKMNFRTDDAFLLRFLRARKFNLERAFQLIVNYYKHRDKYPQFYRKPLSDLENAMASNYQGALTERDSEGRAIYICNSAFHWDPSLYSLEDLAANVLRSFERLVEDEDVQLNGLVVLVDTKGLNYKHLLKLYPHTLKKIFDAAVNTFPIRFKAIHFINEPFIFDAMFMIIRPFYSKKLLSRIHFHGGSVGTLHDFVSPDIIPEEYGGNRGPFNNQSWNEVLRLHEKTMIENMKFGFVEDKT